MENKNVERLDELDEVYYKELADRVRYFKEDEKGVRIMCEIMDEIREKKEKKWKLK